MNNTSIKMLINQKVTNLIDQTTIIFAGAIT